MVDRSYWSTPAVASKTGEVLRLLVYCSLGIFLFDLTLNASFDWSILSGKRQRKWPHLLYLGTKFIFFTFLVLNMVMLWLEKEINCQSAMIAIEWCMGITVIMSSALLACRTVCVFFDREKTMVLILLAVFGSALVTVWMVGVQDVTAKWEVAAASPWNSGACVPTLIKPTYFVKYIITIVFDLLVLCLTTIGILRLNSCCRMGDILIKHGLFYFILTLFANLVITILTILNLSPIMSLIAATPQSLICVIASTHLYRNLSQEASSTSIKSTLSSNSLFSNFFKRRKESKLNQLDSYTTSSIDGLERRLPMIHVHQEIVSTVMTLPHDRILI